MARMIARVHQALKSAGAPQGEARAAATAVAESATAALRSDLKLLEHMVGVNTGLLLIVLGKLFLLGAWAAPRSSPGRSRRLRE